MSAGIANVKPFGEAFTRQSPENRTASTTEKGQDAGPHNVFYAILATKLIAQISRHFSCRSLSLSLLFHYETDLIH